MDHEPIIIVIVVIVVVVVVVTCAQYKVLFFLLSVAETERRSVEDDLEHSANPLNFYEDFFLVSMQTSLHKTDGKVNVLKWFCSLAVLKTTE